jgi:hypothetical protein
MSVKLKTSLREYKYTGGRIEKDIISYDKNNVEINKKKFVNGKLYSETICSDSNSNTKKFFYIGQESPDGYIDKIITYNTKGLELTISSLTKKGKRKLEEFKKHMIAAIIYYLSAISMKKKNFFCPMIFHYDNQNNWTSLTHKQLIINTTKGEEKETYETTVFKQIITYLPNK